VSSNNSDDEKDKPQKKGTSRRTFLTHLGFAGAIAATGRNEAVAANENDKESDAPKPIEGAVAVSLLVNGQKRNLKLDPRTTLLDCLRENLQLTGTKKGCDHGQCGACTIHVNGRRVNSCLTLAVTCDGDEITTIEGLGLPDKMHPMQSAFVDCDAYQCGYCTSGQIMSATALLKEGCPSEDNGIRECMSGNICRCGAYPNILAAIKQVKSLNS
jgi:xanthine dehydrogenase YagT iron-sulfur-binding subunit